MRKNVFLIIIGTIALVFELSSCNFATKRMNVDGVSQDIDTFVINHYHKNRIEKALQRDAAMNNVVFPTDARYLGVKKAEVTWRAFDEDFHHIYRDLGVVTVVHYEHGLEIKKDGQSWYYDGIEYNEDNLTDISAALSILHRPQWEPALIGYKFNHYTYEFLYPLGNTVSETVSIIGEALYDKYKINYKTDLIVSNKEY